MTEKGRIADPSLSPACHLAAPRRVGRQRPTDRMTLSARTLAGMGGRLAAIEGHREEIRAVARQHRAVSVAVFGSVARGEDGPGSDVDLLVEFAPGASLLDLMGLQDDLEALLGCRVDVVSVGGMKDRDEHIRREAIPV